MVDEKFTEDEPRINEEDAEELLEFSRQLDLLQSKYSDYRHEKLLRHSTIMAEQVGGLLMSQKVEKQPNKLCNG